MLGREQHDENFVKGSDIVDAVNSSDATKVLSAKAGKSIWDESTKTKSGSGSGPLAAMNSLISNMGGNNMVLYKPYGAVLTNTAWDTAYGWLMRIATNDYVFQGSNRNGHHCWIRVAGGSLATNKAVGYS